MNRETRQERDMTNKPAREDVHEQRHPDQPREGVVPKKGAPTPPSPRPPTPSKDDRDRADWEGMGQPQGRPPAEE